MNKRNEDSIVAIILATILIFSIVCMMYLTDSSDVSAATEENGIVCITNELIDSISELNETIIDVQEEYQLTDEQIELLVAYAIFDSI